MYFKADWFNSGLPDFRRYKVLLIQAILFGIVTKAVVIYGFLFAVRKNITCSILIMAICIAIGIECIDFVSTYILTGISRFAANVSDFISNKTKKDEVAADRDIIKVKKAIDKYQKKGGKLPATITASSEIIQKIRSYSVFNLHEVSRTESHCMFMGCFIRLGVDLEPHEFYIENFNPEITND